MLGQCQPIEIARNQGSVLTVDVDETFIYWGGDGSVVAKKSIDNTGKVIELVPAASQERAYCSALVDQTLYWGNDWQDNTGVTTVASKGLAYLNGLAVRGNSLFVLEYPRNGGTDRDAQILRVPLAAGVGSNDAPAFAAAGLGAPSMAVDDSGVYWTRRDTAGLNEPGGFSIRHCALTGCTGAPELLAATVSASAITTDAKAVYWTTETGLVMKLAK